MKQESNIRPTCCNINTSRYILLKVHGPIFQTLVFSFIRRIVTPKVNLKFRLKHFKPFGCMKQICILQLPISYCISLVMVNITTHIFINIFHMERLSAVKFALRFMRKISAFL